MEKGYEHNAEKCAQNDHWIEYSIGDAHETQTNFTQKSSNVRTILPTYVGDMRVAHCQ